MLDAARKAVRWAAASKSGLWLEESVSPAPAQFWYLDTLSTPAETIAWASPDLMAWKAIRKVCRLEAQKRLIVAAGTRSSPAWTATTRAMLEPASPLGSAQPSRMSSKPSPSSAAGSKPGTFARAACTMAVARSSGRSSLREPLKARPIGLLAVATMTASVMAPAYARHQVGRRALARETGRLRPGEELQRPGG